MPLAQTCMALLASAAAVSAAAVPAPPVGCTLPATYKWKAMGPLTTPKLGGDAKLREFTHVPYKGKNLVYATTNQPYSYWGSMNFDLFSDWTAMDSTTQNNMTQPAVSPSLIYFAPKKTWILSYQWGRAGIFSYKTSSEPENANGWSVEQALYTGTIPKSDTGPIDPVLIGDDKNMYLFFAADNGNIYRASMGLDKFPASFGNVSTVVLTDTRANLFESPQVYTIRDGGKKKYLMLVEALGRAGRFMRSFTADRLDGAWTVQAGTEEAPFAGKSNSDAATFANDVSQAELLRSGPDQTRPVDLCKLQVLFQGRKLGVPDAYYPPTYVPGLLTLSK